MTFEEFAAQRRRSLLRFAMVLAGDARQAEDIVQAVLMRVWQRWDRIAAMDGQVAYARRMVVNEYLSLGRRFRRTVPFDPAEHDSGEPDRSTAHAERDALVRELARLPRRQRAVLALRYFEGCGDAEIAALLGCGEVTVRTHASRGLARLRVQITTPQSHLERS